MFKIFVVLLLCHLIVDFLLQPERLVELKKRNHWAIIFHALVHFGVSSIAMTIMGSFQKTVIAIMLISSVNYLMDCFKNNIERDVNTFQFEKIKQKWITCKEWIAKSRTLLFTLDLIVHITVIYISVYYFVSGMDYNTHKEKIGKVYSILFGNGIISSEETKFVCLIITVLILSSVSSVFITNASTDILNRRKRDMANNSSTIAHQETAAAVEGDTYSRNMIIPPFASFKSEGPMIKQRDSTISAELYLKSEVEAFYKHTENEHKDFHLERTLEITEKESNAEVKNKIVYHTSKFNESSPNIAKYIGIIERFLIAVLVVKGAFTGIAFLGTLKAIARYKQFDEKNYAEKFLLGTLISALLGLICGMIIIRIFNISMS
ncbi:Protein of unknown function [Paenibacillus sp. yr247]|uniref:DUF3307 domain-containing protein n=1 Tax=Paenibacillus sp. yr247 TaxID=1761880 RepID=UPI00089090AC|nr:DUF3307 domain-containing protein [Paenibacillus sp. yr247]SDN81962.1 Protein of unknown function [Paenibacillus sp. yr247]